MGDYDDPPFDAGDIDDTLPALLDINGTESDDGIEQLSGEADGDVELAGYKAYCMSATDQVYNIDESGVMLGDLIAVEAGARQVIGEN